MKNRTRKNVVQVYLSDNEKNVIDMKFKAINQIVRRINGTGNMYEADMQELKKEIENVWHIQKSILSALPLEELSDTSLIPKKRTENS